MAKVKKTVKLQCPKCKSDNLGRLERLIGDALITVVDADKKTWTYVGETKVDWDSQGRNTRDTMPEFECRACGEEFNVRGAKESNAN